MSQSGEGSVWYQREIAISAKKRGCHLITDDVLHQVPEIQKIKIGTANVHSKKLGMSYCLHLTATSIPRDVYTKYIVYTSLVYPSISANQYIHTCML